MESEKTFRKVIYDYFDLINSEFILRSQDVNNELIERRRNLKDIENLDLSSGYSFSFNTFTSNEERLEIIEFKKRETKTLLSELYYTSKIADEYWQFCSFITYKNNYKKRLKDFINQNNDKGLKKNDFVTVEISILKNHDNAKFLNLFDESIVDIIKKEFSKKLAFLEKKRVPYPSEIPNNIQDIFTSKKSKTIFERLIENIDQKKTLSEISFIYRQMYQDKLIYESVKPEIFRNFISSSPYNIETNHSLKSLYIVSTNTRESNYNNIKEIVFKNK